MTISISRKITEGEYNVDQFSQILREVDSMGYDPLILHAKRRFVQVISGSDELAETIAKPLDRNRVLEFVYRRYPLARFRRGDQIVVAGDVFLTQDAKGLLYISLQLSEIDLRRSKNPDTFQAPIEVGLIGRETTLEELNDFVEAVSSTMKKHGMEVLWKEKIYENPQFAELSQSEETQFIPASALSEDDLNLAQTLEDRETRNLAIMIRRAGGMLLSDVEQKAKIAESKVKGIIDTLVESELLSLEYVVICRKTSNQVNRVDSLDKIAAMKKMGIKCSCGRSISDERIEELIVPTEKLQKLLNQSYWMTAQLVRSLMNLNIPECQILLNLREGAEEIDAFVDVDGLLLMFELKDNEFSMGHAYPFGGRIGLYKPEYAIIVSTKGVDPDVKSYFERVRPDAEIVYVENLKSLTPSLEQVIEEVRASRVRELIESFDPMATIEMPISEFLLPKLGLELPRRRRPRP